MRKIIITTPFALLPSIAGAAIEQDVQDILENVVKVIDPMLAVIMLLSFIMGVIFIMRGLLMLRAFSLPLTQATRPGELAGPLVYIVVGAVMVYIPSATDHLSNTVFGTSGSVSIFGSGGDPTVAGVGKGSEELMGYGVSASVEDQWATLVDTIVYYMAFIGFIAFIRGWLLIAHAGQPGVQPGTISRGIIHIVGGILAINFLPLIEAVHNTIVG